jgi:hypothetical protein
MRARAALDDATLEWAAREIERGDLSDLRGVMAPKKRAREDAALRRLARKDLRKELAAFLRAFKSRDDLSPRSVLRRIAEADEKSHIAMLTDAWPLAWDQLVNITAQLSLADNCVPPEIAYRIEITEKGHALLASPQSPLLPDEAAVTTGERDA